MKRNPLEFPSRIPQANHEHVFNVALYKNVDPIHWNKHKSHYVQETVLVLNKMTVLNVPYIQRLKKL